MRIILVFLIGLLTASVAIADRKSDEEKILHFLENNEGVKALKNGDTKTGISILEKDCNGNNALSCHVLGILYAEQDYLKTVKYFEKACNKNHFMACVDLGNLYDQGKGVKQDYFKAVELYEKACNGKDSVGCYNVGTMYESGKGVVQSKYIALEFYSKACYLQDQQGCYRYSVLKNSH